MHFEIRDFRRCRKADVPLGGVVVLAGNGGEGKTSALQAIAAAVTGAPIPAGMTKAQVGRLVRAGAEKASVTWVIDDETSARVDYPKAEYETSGAPPAVSEYAAGLVNLLELKREKRAAVLAPLLGSEPEFRDILAAVRDARLTQPSTTPASEEERAQVAAAGLDPDAMDQLALWRETRRIVDRINELGWEGAHRKAAENGRELKAKWNVVTGGETWGSSKAESWLPEHWSEDLVGSSLQALDAAVAAAEAARDKAVGAQAVDEAEIERLRTAAEGLAALEQEAKALETAKNKAYDAWQAIVAKGRPGVPVPPLSCPHPACGKPVQIKRGPDGREVTLAIPEADAPTADDVAKAVAAQTAYDERAATAKQGHDSAAADHRAKQQAVVEARLAKTTLDEALAKRSAGTVGESGVEAAREAVRLAQQRRDAFSAKIEADLIHRSIMVNQLRIDLLGEEGVRRTKLRKVLDGFNERVLEPLWKAAGWAPVTLNLDLEVEYDGWTWPSLCKSQRRAVTLFAQVVMAKLDGSALVLLDDADEVFPNGREGLLRLLIEAEIPAVVAFMVPRPDSVPDLAAAGVGTTLWFEAGVARPAAEALARAAA